MFDVKFVKYRRQFFAEDKEKNQPKKTKFKWKFKIGKQYRKITLKDASELILTYYSIFDKQKFVFPKDTQIIKEKVTDEVLDSVDIYLKRDYYHFKCKVNGEKYIKPIEDNSDEDFMEETKKRVNDRLEENVNKENREKEIEECLEQLGYAKEEEESEEEKEERIEEESEEEKEEEKEEEIEERIEEEKNEEKEEIIKEKKDEGNEESVETKEESKEKDEKEKEADEDNLLDKQKMKKKQTIRSILNTFAKNQKIKLDLKDPKIMKMLEDEDLVKADHVMANYLLSQNENKNELSFEEILGELNKNDIDSKFSQKIIQSCKKVIELGQKYKQVKSLDGLELKKKEKTIDTQQIVNTIGLMTNQVIAKQVEEKIVKLEQGFKTIKSKIVDTVDFEKVAKIVRAVQIFFGMTLRKVQLVSLVSLLLKDVTKPRILEVKTGEGKTLIIQCLTLYKVLEGVQVDITTSNEVLAKQNAESSIPFFEKFGISVDYLRGDENEEERDPVNGKKCYNADVLFGTAHLFSSDILFEHNGLMNVRNGRRKSYMIVDEVDSMMLDSINYKTIISNPGSRRDLFDHVKEQIWFNLLGLVYLEEDPITQFEQIEEKLEKIVLSFIGYQQGFYEKSEELKAKEFLKDWISSAWHALFFLDRDVDYTVSIGPLKVCT